MNVRIFWVRAMECMCAQSFGGMESEPSEPMLTAKEKSTPEAQRRIEPATLQYAGQQAQHTTDWAIPAPNWSQKRDNY